MGWMEHPAIVELEVQSVGMGMAARGASQCVDGQLAELKKRAFMRAFMRACMPLDLYMHTHLPACMAGWTAAGAGRTGRTGRTLEMDARDGRSGWLEHVATKVGTGPCPV